MKLIPWADTFGFTPVYQLRPQIQTKPCNVSGRSQPHHTIDKMHQFSSIIYNYFSISQNKIQKKTPSFFFFNILHTTSINPSRQKHHHQDPGPRRSRRHHRLRHRHLRIRATSWC